MDIVNDGEVSKPSYATYVTERLSGFGGEPVPFQIRDLEAFPEFAQRMIGDPDLAAVFGNPSCNGPVAYLDTSLVEADIANLRSRCRRCRRGVHVGGLARASSRCSCPTATTRAPRSTCSRWPTR